MTNPNDPPAGWKHIGAFHWPTDQEVRATIQELTNLTEELKNRVSLLESEMADLKDQLDAEKREELENEKRIVEDFEELVKKSLL